MVWSVNFFGMEANWLQDLRLTKQIGVHIWETTEVDANLAVLVRADDHYATVHGIDIVSSSRLSQSFTYR